MCCKRKGRYEVLPYHETLRRRVAVTTSGGARDSPGIDGATRNLGRGIRRACGSFGRRLPTVGIFGVSAWFAMSSMICRRSMGMTKERRLA